MAVTSLAYLKIFCNRRTNNALFSGYRYDQAVKTCIAQMGRGLTELKNARNLLIVADTIGSIVNYFFTHVARPLRPIEECKECTCMRQSEHTANRSARYFRDGVSWHKLGDLYPKRTLKNLVLYII